MGARRAQERPPGGIAAAQESNGLGSSYGNWSHHPDERVCCQSRILCTPSNKHFFFSFLECFIFFVRAELFIVAIEGEGISVRSTSNRIRCDYSSLGNKRCPQRAAAESQAGLEVSEKRVCTDHGGGMHQPPARGFLGTRGCDEPTGDRLLPQDDSLWAANRLYTWLTGHMTCLWTSSTSAFFGLRQMHSHWSPTLTKAPLERIPGRGPAAPAAGSGEHPVQVGER